MNLYMSLFHGRTDPEKDMDDWGDTGPLVGPIDFGWTYGTLRIFAPDGSGETDLPIHEDTVVLDGIYYGDFALLRLNEDELSKDRYIMPYKEFETLVNLETKARKGTK